MYLTTTLTCYFPPLEVPLRVGMWLAHWRQYTLIDGHRFEMRCSEHTCECQRVQVSTYFQPCSIHKGFVTLFRKRIHNVHTKVKPCSIKKQNTHLLFVCLYPRHNGYVCAVKQENTRNLKFGLQF